MNRLTEWKPHAQLLPMSESSPYQREYQRFPTSLPHSHIKATEVTRKAIYRMIDTATQQGVKR